MNCCEKIRGESVKNRSMAKSPKLTRRRQRAGRQVIPFRLAPATSPPFRLVTGDRQPDLASSIQIHRNLIIGGAAATVNQENHFHEPGWWYSHANLRERKGGGKRGIKMAGFKGC